MIQSENIDDDRLIHNDDEITICNNNINDLNENFLKLPSPTKHCKFYNNFYF